MNTTLTGPGALLKSSWAFYKAHWKILTELIAIPYIGVYLGSIFGQMAARYSGDPSAALYGMFGFVISIASGVFLIAAMNGLVSAIDRLSKGMTVSLGAQYRIGFSYFWPIVLIMIIRGAASLGSFALLIVPGIVFSVYSIFVMLSLIVDDRRGFSAFTDSFALVHKRWWGVLGRIVALILCYIIAALVMKGVAALISAISGYAIASTFSVVVTMVLSAILILVFGPFALVYLYKLFMALKAAKTATPDQEQTFKKWVIAFVIIGAIGAVLLPLIGFQTLIYAARHGAFDRLKDAAAQGQRLRMTSTSTPQSNGSLVN